MREIRRHALCLSLYNLAILRAQALPFATRAAPNPRGWRVFTRRAVVAPARRAATGALPCPPFTL